MTRISYFTQPSKAEAAMPHDTEA